MAGILRRTNADKRRAVEIALKEFPKLSSREIAKVCAVGDQLVNQLRDSRSSETATRIGADGKERKMPTPAKRAEPAEEADAEPSKPDPREIAVPFVVPPQPETRSATQRPILCGICVALSPSEVRWCPEWGSHPHSLAGTGF